jgi:MFS family permease
MTVGQIKVIIDRAKSYAGLGSFAMVTYLFIDRVGWHWWFWFIIPAGLALLWIDLRFILPSEINYLHRKSPVLRELLRRK